MSRDIREAMQRVLLAQAAMLLDLMNCAEYTHDNGVVSVRVARSGVDESANATQKEVIRAGSWLANCAFNLSQRPHLDARERETLDECRKAWDDAIRALNGWKDK